VTQLTLDQARADRDQAMHRVEQHADPDWKRDALLAVRRTCLAMPEFICDDVWELGRLREPLESRALGPVIRRAAKLGWCSRTDRVAPSVRSHGSPKPLWRSNLYEART
jgi:hypothetical protein